MMTHMFDTQPSGFRLATLEVFNWGTFDGQVYRITPEGKNAVLTGANGSGKSTLVDALLTLLVENRGRNYNLASGAGSKRERSERTYILGQYSRERGETASDTKSVTLRTRDDYTVLLATFEDALNGRIVTLVAMMWLNNAESAVEHRYYVAQQALSIEEHFSQRHINARDLPNGVEVCNNNFSVYIKAARKALGLTGHDKALDLFNQTVAVKDIPSLNQFVRDHMLEDGKAESHVEGLRQQYSDLNDAHEAITRADSQLRTLTPLIDAAEEYRRYERQIEQYRLAYSLVGFYVAEQAVTLLGDELHALENRQAAEQEKLQTVDNELIRQREHRDAIKIALAQDDVGREIGKIETELPHLRSQIQAKKPNANRYDSDAKRLGLAAYEDEASFHQNRVQVNRLSVELNTAIRDFEEQRFNLRTDSQQMSQREKALKEEIQYLRSNPSQIPERVASIRQKISTDLQIPIAQLPFIGELIKVREHESLWEGVLERLLHSFAQELIVPEEHYASISAYVNERNLRGRLVYRRLHPNQAREDHRSGGRYDAVMAYDKLEIHPETPYRDWLINRLREAYNYECCDTLDAFQHTDRAITPQGQIKHSRSRHEKDDRSAIDERKNYVLGWDNRAKLEALEQELHTLSQQITKYAHQITQVEENLSRTRADVNACDNLLKISEFQEIDWRSHQADIDRLQRRLAELRQNPGRLQLETQLKQLENEVHEANKRRDAINRTLTTLQNKQREYEQLLGYAKQRLDEISPEQREQLATVRSRIAEVEREPLTIDRIQTRTNELEATLQRSISGFSGRQTTATTQIINVMNTFRREYPAEGASLPVEISALRAYEQIYQRLEHDDLPKYRERFKEMLNRKVLRGITTFKGTLDKQVEDIGRSISELNDSLRTLDYGGKNYIRLIAESSHDPEIHDFNQSLRRCLQNAGNDTPEELERVYQEIQQLIQRFNDDPAWMRRVIDVRRWRTFAAEQVTQAGVTVDYYTDSSGKSGGQKAKLAYTILASAIAYQYGLQGLAPNERSFRFVVIDEAFSKLDDENARYAMQLFEQLGLQLLVVTPMQQLQIIEKYVKVFHYVVTNEEGNRSQVMNLTDAEYRRRRQEILSNGHHA